MVGFCHIWIPKYGLISRPLYEKLKGKDDPFEWDCNCVTQIETRTLIPLNGTTQVCSQVEETMKALMEYGNQVLFLPTRT